MTTFFSAAWLLAQQTTDGGGGGAAAGAAFGGFFLIILLLIAVTSIFWIWMLVDCLTSNLPSTEKIIWLLVIFFGHLLGAIIYFFVVRAYRGRTAVS